MSRRRGPAGVEVLGHSVTLICDRRHPVQVVARVFVSGSGHARPAGTKLLIEQNPRRGRPSATVIEVHAYDCTQCGLDVQLSQDSADRVFGELLTEGAFRVRLSELNTKL